MKVDGRHVPYDDATGKPLKTGDTIKGKITIGWGRNIQDMGVSDDEATVMLQGDIDRVTAEIRKALPWFDGLDAVRQDALVNLGFNLGVLTGNPPKLLTFKGTLAAFEAHDWETVCCRLDATLWRKQVGHRADELMAMIRTGLYQE